MERERKKRTINTRDRKRRIVRRAQTAPNNANAQLTASAQAKRIGSIYNDARWITPTAAEPAVQ